MSQRSFAHRLLVRGVLAASIVSPLAMMSSAIAQVAPPPGAPPQQAAPQTFTPQQLDQMLAPIALYPDQLLSQVLMASTYPIEVVDADRWVKANPSLQGDAMAQALDQQPWDPSVKSLVNVPQVLDMMSTQLDWTTRIGDAFIGQQPDVMNRVQALRAQAQQAGALVSSPQAQVVVADQSTGTPDIQINDVDPNELYVPVYDPNVVYGTWAYADYPPYYYYPAGYTRQPGIFWGFGFHLGPPWGYAWGRWDWHGHDLVVDVNRNANYNHSIDRARYEQAIAAHDTQFHGNAGVWEHDPDHRRGVYYRDPAVAQRYGGVSAADAVRGREAYRGRTDGGTQQRTPPVIINTPVTVTNQQRTAEHTTVSNNNSSHVPTPTGTQDITRAPANGQDINRAPTNGQDISRAVPADTGTRSIVPTTPRDVSGRGGAFGDIGDTAGARADAARGEESRSAGARPNSGAGNAPNASGAANGSPPIRGGSPVGGGNDGGGARGGGGGGSASPGGAGGGGGSRGGR